ncbi:unnamed protein product [Eretmochelys imbricata]
MQSQNRKRAPAWSELETLDLIAVWGEESLQAELQSSRRNTDIYAKIAQGMVDRDYTRDTQQCHMKIKELRQAYQKTKEANGPSGSEAHTCRFYDQLHGILGGNPTTTPPLSMNTCKGEASRNTEEDFVDEEEEEEEENAQQASGESVLPGSQDLFITLEPIPSQGVLFPDPEGGEVTSGSAPVPTQGAGGSTISGAGGPPPPTNVTSNRRLQQTQAQVDEVVDIMRVNVDKVLERDQKLSELDNRADALQAGASQFETSAAKLKRKYWWKNCKMMIILGVVCAVILIVIIIYFCT